MLIPRIVNPGLGWFTIIEDSIGYGMLILGFFAFRKPVQKNIARLDSIVTWSSNPIERSLREILSIAKWVLGTAVSILLLISLWFHFKGPPKFIERLDEMHMESKTGKKPNFRDDVFTGADSIRKFPPPRMRKGLGPPLIRRDSAAYFIEEVFGMSLLLFLLLFGTEEVSALNSRIQRKALEEERKVKDEAVSRYAALQQQLNPHFMFNTLNVLTGLVHEDADKAEEYIKKLSDVYRYVLTQSNQATTTIEAELDFIQDYIFLQKIRFDEKLILNINAPDEYLSRRIPSLAIELLVENAIKHNSIKTSSPLIITVTVSSNSVEVTNNIQLRLDDVDSTEVGLANLIARMQLLGLEPPVSSSEDGIYRTVLPLLPSEE